MLIQKIYKYQSIWKAIFIYYVLIIFIFSTFSCQNNNGIIFDKNDIWIKNGLIIDGTGSKAFQADIIINGDSISYIGNVPKETQAIKIVDASNKIVTPGFIDPHSHGDPIKNPLYNNFLSMGVTTITLGQDGTSPSNKPISKWFEDIEELRLGPNIIPFVGHGTLRMRSGIGYKKSPSNIEINKLVSILYNELDAGAFGMSTGLEYVPGRYADQYELNELAKVVGQFDGLIMSHMRTENDATMQDDLHELFEQGNFSNIHISHLKVVHGQGSDRAQEILDMMSNKRKSSSFSVTADIYPYLASYTTVGILFPEFSLPPNNYNLTLSKRRGDLLQYVRSKVERRNGPSAILFGTDPYKGFTLKQLSDKQKIPYEEILVDKIGPSGASAAYFTMDKDLQYHFIKDKNIVISSDGSPTMHHPRGYGSFSKVIQTFVLEEKFFSIQESIRKMTSLPAKIIGLKNRGKISTGFKADILIFNPDSIRSNATFTSPHQISTGIDHIIINGKIERGYGRLLKKNH